jgi:hypothetical protein
MKSRNGFVSNSSSSSFICSVCGSVESGYEASYSEFGWTSCSNNHELCDSCRNKGISDTPTFTEEIQSMKNSIKSYKQTLTDIIDKSIINENGVRLYQREVYEDGDYRNKMVPIEELSEYSTPSYLETTIKDLEQDLIMVENLLNVDPIDYASIRDIFNRYYDFDDYGEMSLLPCDCPVCNLSHIDADDILKYLAKTKGFNINEITSDIRNKFNTLDALSGWLSQGEQE